MLRQILFAAAFTAMVAGGAGLAHAAPMSGPVAESVFISAGLGNGSSYTFLGTSTAAFTGSGGGTLTLRDSSYDSSFGYSNTSHGMPSVIFAANAAKNSTTTIAPAVQPFLFYFATKGEDVRGQGDDPAATVYTDGVKMPGSASQVGLAIYKSQNTYAFFFDDGGPSGCKSGNGSNCTPNDDDDYNDLVVTFTPTAVPEPMSIALLGAGLVGAGLVRRLKTSRS